MSPAALAHRCDCHVSDRCWEVAGGYTSRESHVRRLDDARADGGTLLGNHAQFCHALFHVSPTPELPGYPPHLETCVRCVTTPGKTCENKGVVAVAALRDAEGTLAFLSRYSVRTPSLAHLHSPHEA